MIKLCVEKDDLDNALQAAFSQAETETAHQFNMQTCNMTDIDGSDTCPICYFRKRVKHHLSELLEVEEIEIVYRE
jgi:hypothetical protein